MLSRIIPKKINVNLIINVQDVILNMKRNLDKDINRFLTFVIYEAKWQIWKNKNNVKYGKEKGMKAEGIVK